MKRYRAKQTEVAKKESAKIGREPLKKENKFVPRSGCGQYFLGSGP